MFACSSSIASSGERLRPAQMGAGCPQKQAVGLLEIARERQVLIGLFVVSYARSEKAQPHAGVSVADDAVPDDLVGPRLDELVQDRGGA